MSAMLIVEPVLEPVSLSEAKDYLRVDGTAEDANLTRLIAAARTWLEGMTRRALLSQTWRYLTPPPKAGVVSVPGTPLRSVLAVRLFGRNGTVTTLQPQDYVVSIGPGGTRVHLRHAPDDVTGAEIDAEIGYGADPADLPEDLRQAVLQLVAHWFERREPVVSGSLAPVPMTVSSIAAPYRVARL